LILVVVGQPLLDAALAQLIRAAGGYQSSNRGPLVAATEVGVSDVDGCCLAFRFADDGAQAFELEPTLPRRTELVL
jgi:hypothetical protein